LSAISTASRHLAGRLGPARLAREALLSVRSWARPWRAPDADRRGRDGPRIAVIGNCQAAGVAASVQVLAPGARVSLFPLSGLRRSHGSIEAMVRALDGFDHVYAQPFAPGFLPPGDAGPLEARITWYPTIVFPAFHPDMVYVGDLANLAEARLAPSPLGHYHSSIVLFAYLEGLDEARTVALFREDVFSRLGYLDGWDAAQRDLLAGAEAIGFGLEREFLRWARRGSFMHVINHPKLPVLGDVARRLIETSGLAPAEVEIGDYLPDDLARDVVWPVYPPLAEHYGIAGSYVFKARARADAVPAMYGLEAFVAASFALYRAQARGSLTCHRIELWRGLPEVRAIFR
jgi:hypothetical protein